MAKAKQGKSTKKVKEARKVSVEKVVVEKESTPVKQVKSGKKLKISFKKPDFHNFNYKPILKILGLVVIIIGSLAIVDLAVQYLNNEYSVAIVDGKRISKEKWVERLEGSYGSTMASLMIEEAVVEQEAEANGITATQDEIQAKLDDIIESIGGQELYESALAANNLTEEELKDQIKLDILSTKLITPTLEYTDDDVKSFFTDYSDVIFPDETEALEDGAELDYETYKDQTEQVYIEQLVSSEFDTWLEAKVAEHTVQDNTTDKPSYGFLTITTKLINNIFNK